MLKSILKILIISISLFFWVKCDNYEFPKSPYPRIETLPVVNITETGVTFQANITQHGKLPTINHGFVWGTDENLSIISDDKIQLGAIADLGNFDADVKSGLSEGETYFVKAFVATDDYFVYGEAISFTSKGSTPPIIDNFEPLIGTWGDTVTIHGSFFGTTPKSNLVRFGSIEAKVIEANETTIICIVPDNIETLVVSISVKVTDNTAQSATNFQLTIPTISSFNPTSGTFQDEVVITGSNFGVYLKSHIVTFGGHVAEVIAFSRTSLKVKVPVEVDLKTNEIKLTLNKQTATAATPFTMLPPTITSLSKTEGRIGDEVEITGENFNPRLLGNLVVFGESQATVVSATHHSLKVKLTNGIYPQRISTVKVTVVEQIATAGNTFKLLDVWLKKAYTPVAEVNCGGFAIENRGYFVAGSNTYSYDPLTNNWTQKANFPGDFRLSAITFAAAGNGYSGAGYEGCCGRPELKDLWRYSASNNTWTMRNDIPDESIGINGTGVGSNGYTVQGFGPTQISEYDPESDTWKTVGEILDANFTGYPHFPYSIFTMDNRIFVFFRDQYNYTSADNYLYEFHIATGKWSQRAAYFDERSLGFSINGIGYIAGFQYIHKYNLATNALTLNAIPVANNNWGTEYLFTANDKAYFLGAWENNHYELWEFDPAYL